MNWRLLPLGLGALAIPVGAVLLIANLTLNALGHSSMKLFPGLTGVTAPVPAPLSLRAVLHGQMEAAYAREVGSNLPLYPIAVRLRNQVEFSLFGFSSTPAVMVARDGALLERPYADEYCSRDLARWRPGALAWAGRIRDMQDELARRGKAFLYVLTPSKVATYPALLPHAFNCPAQAADRAGLIPEWTSMLRIAGVNMVDTTAVLRAAAPSYPFALFPPGGTHWNAVAAALAQQQVVAALGRELPDRGFVPTPFTWHMLPHPVRDSDDEDLARLMNLFVSAAQGPVPAVEAARMAAPPSCAPPRVVIIGGSFSHATLKALAELPCPSRATEYEYWHVDTLHWSQGGLDRHTGVDPDQREADLLAADVVIYEENEQILSQPFHGQALAAFLQATAAR